MNYEGPIVSKEIAWRATVSFVGCPHRGTFTCWRCPWEPVMECDYRCGICGERHRCKCGHDYTEMLKTMGLVE